MVSSQVLATYPTDEQTTSSGHMYGGNRMLPEEALLLDQVRWVQATLRGSESPVAHANLNLWCRQVTILK